MFRSQTNQALVRAFNELFKKDSQGKQHEWRDLEETKIKEIFDCAKAKLLSVLDQFKEMVLPRNLTVLDEPEINTVQTSFEINEFIKSSKQKVARTSTLGNKNVITVEEINRVREKFVSDMDFAFEEAIQKHRGISSSAVPIWLWAVLLYFASDNILGYMASPILFYPMVLIGSIVFCAWQLDVLFLLIEIATPQVRQAINQVLMKTPLTFRL